MIDLDPKIQRVLSKLNKQSNRERQGKANVEPGQQMLAITSETGMFFSILLKATKARHILEVGTSVGFSTMWFADAIMMSSAAISRKPYIMTIEENHKKVERAIENFKQAGVKNIIRIKEGNALDVLQQVKKKDYFDFIFLDADKENMIKYFDLVLPMVRVGGIIAADNMLYPEQYRQWMNKYSRYVKSKPNVQSVTIPIGMGEELTIRLS